MTGILADVVVLVHLGWILFLVFGVFLGRRLRWVRWLHLGGLAVAVVLTACGWICPLTHAEVWLRRRAAAPDGGYPGTFVGHYAERLVYLDVPRWAVLVVVVGVAGLTIWAYAGGGRKRGPGPEEGT